MTEQAENWRKWATTPALWEKLKPLVREKRCQPTSTEDLLWQRLRDRKFNGLRFRRQHPIERFIVDFYCAQSRLVIEIDGEIHQYSVEEDAIRQSFLESLNMRVLRVTNDEVLHSITAVLENIAAATDSPSLNSERGPGGEVK